MVRSIRKSQALNGGVSGKNAGKPTDETYLVGTRHITLTQGSTMNWNGDSKMGLPSNVGVSLFSLRLFSNCGGCKKGFEKNTFRNGAITE
jgi:hypothetical protein